MRNRLKDLEMQKQLLQSQNRILKSNTLKELGTVQDIHKKMQKSKLKAAKLAQFVQIPSQSADFSEQFTEGLQQKILDNQKELMLIKKH